MGAFVDIAGRRFGRLIVTAREKSNHAGKTRWLCKCDCGGSTTTITNCLRSGQTRSCGCLVREHASTALRIANRTHGKTNHPLFKLWTSLRSRCRNPNATGYDRYGGRGIKICAQWDDFEKFLEDIGPRPSAKHSLDRIDNDGDYEPGNVRWATAWTQNTNTRANRYVTYRGRVLCQREAWRLSGCVVSRTSFERRLRRGWTVENALEIPDRRVRRVRVDEIVRLTHAFETIWLAYQSGTRLTDAEEAIAKEVYASLPERSEPRNGSD